MPTHLIVLAAGQGTRMQSDLPKVLHEVGQAPLFVHALASGDELEEGRRVLVVGHGAEAVRKSALDHDPEITVAVQETQEGTAHAVAQARAALEGASGTAFVLYGDTPFIRPETLARMAEARKAGAAVVVLGFEARDPGRYGRLVMEGESLLRIVEYKDASDGERAITLCNSGVICADVELLFELIDAVGNDNASGEYYLTDIIGIARDRGLDCTAVTCDEAETMGVNSRLDLAEAERVFQSRRRQDALETGVTLVAPETVFFAQDTVLGRDAVIEPNVVFGPGVTVESHARIRAFSHVEGAHVGARAVVGPYARLRPGAELGNDSRVGNFCEVKAAEIGEGAKVNHLTYIGDASVGAGSNIGAGTITCNYDGYFKHRTEIGENAFIGSSTMLVAPVRIGNGALTGSGSVITSDVPDGALALGRARQEVKPGLATKLMARLRAAKEKVKS
ncbi:bifunctional UDP-N-acetylglucosamine diphosphorylase/glucosamine-1-phosphate N-acetyltransferase GlmU [Palleronia caenipelagi]|uniref:Bifunctional protein GlmU n=1 Tax=Palleronia caenipelagi TaxID=2489174 RepID=A0A547Q534_9RHOB|nr:bifunctional UDP-N-acetylglucosamine diphosphorylase/glucosamine-1-phosphate N-acetyltransferase GlmU [Palleronia caenipelagi]TRD21491.1 bifunctional UDP-N-acetylglucosamine diphosphorylase/glucosamine-1-phosphate N-acetyltransferase GlmU [Palleronia caenipelagi]